jgi:uncharacterized protein
MKRFFVLPLILFFLGSNCYASNEPVDKMFKVMQMDKQLNGGFEAMLPLIDQMALKFNLDANAKEELKNIYRAWFDKDIDRTSVLNKMKELYSNTFNKKEIEEITKFYQTQIGQKFLKKSPELMGQGAQIGMAEAQSKQTLLLNRLTPFFEKHNIK